jgi:CelD/BcsL family acetyltransferase involved in cellulose biosynthesis
MKVMTQPRAIPSASAGQPSGSLRLVSSSPALEVQEIHSRWDFARLENEWNELAKRASPFSQHRFLRIWIDNFAPRARLRILLARDHGALVGALPLMEETGFLGLPLRQWVSTANPHSCRFDLLAKDPLSVSAAFLSYLAVSDGWDVLRINDIPEGGGGWHIQELAKAAQLPVGIWESLRSPYLPLPSAYSTLEQGLHGKFRSNLRRRRRRLAERGEVIVERVTGGPELEARLEEGFELERAGWKGDRGTAIAQDGATRGFYSELARCAAYAGELSLFFLRLNGRAVAFQYGLLINRRYHLLKPAYDEELSECSPGQLLMEEVLKDCIERGAEEFDFLGPDMPWKRDWTSQVRPHHWLFVFRNNPVGRGLRRAKFDWVPTLKRLMPGNNA